MTSYLESDLFWDQFPIDPESLQYVSDEFIEKYNLKSKIAFQQQKEEDFNRLFDEFSGRERDESQIQLESYLSGEKNTQDNVSKTMLLVIGAGLLIFFMTLKTR